MRVHTIPAPGVDFAAALADANKQGQVQIVLADGSRYVLAALTGRKSPLDVQGVNIGLKSGELLEYIHEGRGRWEKQ